MINNLEIFANTNNSSSEWNIVSNTKLKKKSVSDVFNSLKDISKLSITGNESNHTNKSTCSNESICSNESNSSNHSNRSARIQRIPTGIVAILDSKTKTIIRELLPNTGKNIADSKIIDMITNMKSDQTLKLFDFKKGVVMIVHQATKKDRASLIFKIFNMWKRYKFPMIELIDSVYDNCKPITQAVWNGSIDCIRTIVSADPDLSNTVLQTINSKGETLEQTLTLGKSYALSKDPSNAIFIEERFKECEKFISSALLTQKRHNEESLDIEVIVDCSSKKLDISSEIMSEIIQIQTSETELMLKIASVYGDDIELSHKYFLATKQSVDEDMFKRIEDTLKDEGIVF
jgi:hypothetical protein